MNLTYRIIWIEDNEEYIESLDRSTLLRHVQEQGFDLDITFKTSPEDIALEVDGNAYDLMVIDYQITEDNQHDGDATENDGSGKTGDDVIKSVREHDCLTEVIFYSGSPTHTLRRLAADRELEGVFFSDRDQEVLIRKICDVFDLTVRKVVDVANMRGIVMAGVADIDHQLSGLLLKLHESLGAVDKEKHHKKIFKKMLEREKAVKKLVQDQDNELLKNVYAAIKSLEELEPKNFDSLIGLREFDSYSRVEAAASLCGKHQTLSDAKGIIEEIKFLLKWRNALAHQCPTNNGGVYTFEPDEGVPEPFDDARTLDLRKRLRDHRLHLAEILTKVPTIGQE
ncbi:MAG: hypothetical protein M0023_01745 [Desulfobacteraceae bacterium]|nr:hypothetical protein [Desulfobacteraceae bacterium]